MAVLRLSDVLRDLGVPDLVELLAERLAAAELDAVLAEVRRRRGVDWPLGDPGDRRWRDPVLRPSRVAARRLAELEAVARSVAGDSYEFVALSPVTPLGVAAALFPVDPGAAWSAGGGHEVLSDARVALAIEIARRRAAGQVERGPNVVRLAAACRELHQPYSAPLRSAAHEAVIAFCHGGVATNDPRDVDLAPVTEQLALIVRLLDDARALGFGIGAIGVHLTFAGPAVTRARLEAEVMRPLTVLCPDVQLEAEAERRLRRPWFAPVEFVVRIEDASEVPPQVAHGGMADWLTRLLPDTGGSLVVSTVAIEAVLEQVGPGLR